MIMSTIFHFPPMLFCIMSTTFRLFRVFPRFPPGSVGGVSPSKVKISPAFHAAQLWAAAALGGGVEKLPRIPSIAHPQSTKQANTICKICKLCWLVSLFLFSC